MPPILQLQSRSAFHASSATLQSRRWLPPSPSVSCFAQVNVGSHMVPPVDVEVLLLLDPLEEEDDDDDAPLPLPLPLPPPAPPGPVVSLQDTKPRVVKQPSISAKDRRFILCVFRGKHDS